MSSRNAFLSAEERQAGLVLYRSLKHAEQLVAQGEVNVEKIREHVRTVIQAESLVECEYVEVYNYPALQAITALKDKALLALAVRIGKTRLIDNTILEVK